MKLSSWWSSSSSTTAYTAKKRSGRVDLARTVLHNQVNVVIYLPHLTIKL